MSRFWVLLASGTISVLFAPAGHAERWTDLRGVNTIEARMLGMWRDNVVLERSTGARLSVPTSKLQAASRIQAEELAGRLTGRMFESVKQLRTIAEEAAAPAPTPLPTPAPAPEYQVPSSGLSIVDTQKAVMTQIANGHLRVLVDTIPDSLRGDVDDVVHSAVRKVDPLLFQAIAKGLHDVGDAVISKQRWFKSHPRFEAMDEEDARNAQDVFMAFFGLLRDGFNPDEFRYDDLANQPLEIWLSTFDERTAPHLQVLLGDLIDPEAMPELDVTENKDGSVTIKPSGSPRTFKGTTYEKIDGMWIPSGFKSMLESAQERLAKIEDGSQGAGMAPFVPGLVTTALLPLQQATNESNYHAAIEDLIGQAGDKMEMATAMLPTDFNLSFPGQSNSGGGMYGDDYYGAEDGYGMDDGNDPYAGSELE